MAENKESGYRLSVQKLEMEHFEVKQAYYFAYEGFEEQPGYTRYYDKNIMHVTLDGESLYYY